MLLDGNDIAGAFLCKINISQTFIGLQGTGKRIIFCTTPHTRSKQIILVRKSCNLYPGRARFYWRSPLSNSIALVALAIAQPLYQPIALFDRQLGFAALISLCWILIFTLFAPRIDTELDCSENATEILAQIFRTINIYTAK